MRLVFLGTADIARPSLRALAGAGHEVAAVVTQPDRPRGRSGAPAPPPLKEEALALGLAAPILQPEKLGRQTRERIAALAPDAGVVVAYGQLISRELLQVPRLGFLNVHASLLPRWRGAAPVQRAIAAGDSETGVTIMRVIPRLDAGPILASRRLAIGPRDTSADVLARHGEIGAPALVETLAALERGDARETPQDEALATYARPIRKEEGASDWTRPAVAIDAHVRAMAPWPGAFASLHRAEGGAPQRIEVLAAAGAPPSGAAAAAEPGTIVEAAGPRLLVACGPGGAEWIAIERVKPAGKREMSVADWLRGRAAKAGDSLRSGPESA